MAEEPNLADELLERARRLEARAEDGLRDAPDSGREDEGPRPDDEERRPEDAGWIVRHLEFVGRVVRGTIGFCGRMITYMGLGRLFEGLKSLFLFASCEEDELGERSLSAFAPKRFLKSMGIAFLIYVVVIMFYVFGTRREGVFLINNYHLIDGESDVYQAGGCMKHASDQTVCPEGEGEIVLIRPSWVPPMGLNPLDYDEDVGQIPIQGECFLGVYGWYLRGPSLTRGLLKPVVYEVQQCRGIGQTIQ